MSVLLGKDDVVSGVNNASVRSTTESYEAVTVDFQPFGDMQIETIPIGYRRTLEIEAFEDNGFYGDLQAGTRVTVSGTSWIVSQISRNSPLDGAVTYRITLKG